MPKDSTTKSTPSQPPQTPASSPVEPLTLERLDRLNAIVRKRAELIDARLRVNTATFEVLAEQACGLKDAAIGERILEITLTMLDELIGVSTAALIKEGVAIPEDRQ